MDRRIAIVLLGIAGILAILVWVAGSFAFGMSVGCADSDECYAIQRGAHLTVTVLPFVVFIGTTVWAIRQMRLGRRAAWIAAVGILLILAIYPACEAALRAAQDDLPGV